LFLLFVDTGGKFAASVVDYGGKLPPASLTLVVHLDLRISPRIFKTIQNDFMLFSGAWGKVIHEKT
jgi:hypothetical protein